MKHYIDTEFLEGTQTKRFLGIPYGKTPPTIDLISIGIVSEDNREYYAISKDFNLKEAWNRFEWKRKKVDDGIPGAYKEYWIRENVLLPIYLDLLKIGNIYGDERNYWSFTYRNLKRLLKWYGKTNKQITEEIRHFVANRHINANKEQWILDYDSKDVQFYAYYADYDWVVFCWLFGKMMDLPKGFSMYCIDLKQTLDEKINGLNWLYLRDTWNNSRMSIKTIGKGDSQEKDRLATFEEKTKRLKELNEYPKQTDEHNALSDAKWNKQLHEFLNQL